jgi:transglutaminase-like putative cysteine protease
MKLFYIVAGMLMLATATYAQQNYDVSLIPKELMPYASAVIRDQNISIEVKDDDNALYHVKTAITVLNSNGDDIARIVLFYDKSRIIKSVKGITYNEFGKPIGKFSEKDFTDQSAINNFSLFEDTRVKHLIPSIGSYPYTIEYEYDIRTKQTLNFDDWQPNSDYGLAVEKSTFTFNCKPGFNIKYKQINLPPKVIITSTKDGFKSYTWQVNNLKAVKYEPYSPNSEQYLTSVKIAPEKFRYEGIPGEYNNWKELGQWNYDKLLVKRRELPAWTVQRMKELTAGITDVKLKAKKVYEYMQGKTRYISVQVGIGGYQPFLASDVDRLSYGDCKALVNYTQALLKAVDIDSWYCVVEAGDRKVSLTSDFATMGQGNHIILCLPLKGDTTFLECTSQKIPFGFLSDFTDDRTVLACTPQGGILLHTPKYTAAENKRSRKAIFSIQNDGLLTGSINTSFEGTEYDSREDIIDEPLNEQAKTLRKRYTAFNNLDIEKVELQQDKAQLPKTTERLIIKAREFMTTDNDKSYFSLNPVNRSASIKDVRNRNNPLYINRGYTDDDEITYTLPDGYKPDMMPAEVLMDKPFGSFKASVVLTGNKLVFKRHFQIIDGTYPKDTYHDFVDFYSKIRDVDYYNVSLVKK